MIGSSARSIRVILLFVVTGQKSDGTGLLYYNARYYDPALGTFLSPDTLVPDAGAVVDYNRFLYAQGNPLKYADPNGHCAVLDDGSADRKGDGDCWDAADEWYKTFGAGDMSKEDWYTSFAGSASITEKVLRGGLYHYWSPLYQKWGVYDKRYNPAPVMNEPPPQPEIHVPGEQIVKAAARDTMACGDDFPWGCGELADDVGAGVATGGVVACAYATGGTCLAVVGGASMLAGGTGAVITTRNAAVGEATWVDAVVSWGTTVAGYRYGHRMEGLVGAGIGVFQRWYDSWSSPQ